jgi:hypothetical protein
MVAQAEPGAGRSRPQAAAPVVHSASLDGPATVRQRRARRSWPCACRSLSRNTRGAHSFDCSMSCAKRHAVMLSRTLRHVSDLAMLFCRPTVPHAAALAIARSAVGASPFPRGASPNCDRTKNQTNTPAADHSQVCCSRYAESLVTVRASRVARSSEARTQELQRLCPVVCRTGAGRRQADGCQSVL